MDPLKAPTSALRSRQLTAAAAAAAAAATAAVYYTSAVAGGLLECLFTGIHYSAARAAARSATVAERNLQCNRSTGALVSAVATEN